jgi:HEAT repeat protein
MARFYCPQCWHDFPEDHDVCPDCNFNIKEFYSSKDYIEKLMRALESPEPSTPVRAAMVLGKIKDTRAVQPLIECIARSEDVYFIREAVTALGEIGTLNAMMFLRSLREQHPSKLVVNQVQSVLDRLYDDLKQKK